MTGRLNVVTAVLLGCAAAAAAVVTAWCVAWGIVG